MPSSFPCRVITLRRFGLNHDAGITSLVILAFVRDGADNVTTLESDRCSESGKCRYQHRNDDFNDLLFGHNPSFL